jgi:hypothetical protein
MITGQGIVLQGKKWNEMQPSLVGLILRAIVTATMNCSFSMKTMMMMLIIFQV